MIKAKCVLLGTGTSQGIPVIGCTCPVCISTDPKDKRLRCSLLLEVGETNIVIDTGPDFRQQMLTHHVSHLNAVLLTHEHNDHIIGLDDIRPFNFKQKFAMPIFALERVINEVMQKFEYVFEEVKYPGSPSVEMHKIRDTIFEVNKIKIEPIHYHHGNLPVVGFRIGDLAYLTDIKTIDKDQIQKLENLNTLIVSALHHREHHSHFNLDEALQFIQMIKPQESYLTHISHRMGTFKEVSETLPSNVHLAYDGLVKNILV